MFGTIAERIEADKDRLCALDGVIGDADHGIAMALGFAAARDALAGLDPASIDPTAIFNTAAKAFLNAVGASSGPLYATAFMRAGAAVKGKQSLTMPISSLPSRRWPRASRIAARPSAVRRP